MTAVTQRLVDLWAEIFPVKGYTGGATNELTTLFMQTPERVAQAQQQIAALEPQLKEILDPDLRFTAQRLLVVLRTALQLPQPNQGINTCGDGFFYILLKGDQQAAFVPAFFQAVEQMVAFETGRWHSGAFAIETKKACLDSANYLLSCAQIVANQNPAVGPAFERVTALVAKYRQLFAVPGLETQDFDQLFKLFEQYEQPAARTPGYPQVLQDLYNLPQSAEQIQAMAGMWLAQELPQAAQLAAEIGQQLGLPAGSDLQTVWDALSAKYAIPDLMPTARKAAEVCNAYAAEYMLAIGPDDQVSLQETPDYLAPLVTGGQDIAVDYLTAQPKSALYLTPAKNTSLLTMLNILVHEFSHGFNFVLSAKHAGSPLLNLDTPMQVALTEGQAFYREFQYYQAAEDLLGRTGLNPVQQAYLNLYGTTPQAQAQAVQGAKLETYIWRIARYLRALCDVEVHGGQRTYTDFINWASATTGLSREFIHGECFSFLVQPGYAPCYAIPGRLYGQAQEYGLRQGVSEKTFNTQASQMGFFPWSLGEVKLRQIAHEPSRAGRTPTPSPRAPQVEVLAAAYQPPGPLTPQEQQMMAKAYRLDNAGWVQIHIEGDPYERGFQHGYLLAKEIQDALRVNSFLATWDTGEEFPFFVENAARLFARHLDAEIADELQGIAAGATRAGFPVSFEEILAWNSYQDIVGSWWPNRQDTPPPAQLQRGHRCSAFIATGKATKTGEIVMAHNTWDRYPAGDHYNIVIDLKPNKGSRMLFQAAPGYVSSTMDWWITSAGLVVTETTIGGFTPFNSAGAPEFYRSRRACQYAANINEWKELATAENNGGYANSWLVGDLKNNQIARIELGLPVVGFESTFDGYFAGYNIASNLKIRNQETSSNGYSDIRRSGARRVRFQQLLEGQPVDAQRAQAIIADHYDVYLQRAENPSSRTICGHLELDDAKYGSHDGQGPFYPWGANDGKVLDAAMARRMRFQGRWGHACGMAFDAQAFVRQNPQYDWLDGYMRSRVSQPWVELAAE